MSFRDPVGSDPIPQMNNRREKDPPYEIVVNGVYIPEVEVASEEEAKKLARKLREAIPSEESESTSKSKASKSALRSEERRLKARDEAYSQNSHDVYWEFLDDPIRAVNFFEEIAKQRTQDLEQPKKRTIRRPGSPVKP